MSCRVPYDKSGVVVSCHDRGRQISIGEPMRTFALLVALTTLAWAQRVPELPKPIDLKQTPARSRAKLRLPKGHSVGPAIPGLKQGANPQGLAFWQQQNWFLISCYFDHKEGESPRKPSVVVAIDAQTRKVVRSLTLLEASGKGHTGHVGGVAVSDTYLWVGSGKLYRVPLADILAAKKVDYLRLQKPFQAETNASYVAYHNKRVWVGEFVSIKDPKFKGKPAHYVKDRSGEQKHAWIRGYALDADENLATVAGNKPVPPVVLSVRDHVQGLAFQQGNIILSTSYGRTKDSHLVVHKTPFPGE